MKKILASFLSVVLMMSYCSLLTNATSGEPRVLEYDISNGSITIDDNDEYDEYIISGTSNSLGLKIDIKSNEKVTLKNLNVQSDKTILYVHSYLDTFNLYIEGNNTLKCISNQNTIIVNSCTNFNGVNTGDEKAKLNLYSKSRALHLDCDDKDSVISKDYEFEINNLDLTFNGNNESYGIAVDTYDEYIDVPSYDPEEPPIPETVSSANAIKFTNCNITSLDCQTFLYCYAAFSSGYGNIYDYESEAQFNNCKLNIRSKNNNTVDTMEFNDCIVDYEIYKKNAIMFYDSLIINGGTYNFNCSQCDSLVSGNKFKVNCVSCVKHNAKHTATVKNGYELNVINLCGLENTANVKSLNIDDVDYSNKKLHSITNYNGVEQLYLYVPKVSDLTKIETTNGKVLKGKTNNVPSGTECNFKPDMPENLVEVYDYNGIYNGDFVSCTIGYDGVNINDVLFSTDGIVYKENQIVFKNCGEYKLYIKFKSNKYSDLVKTANVKISKATVKVPNVAQSLIFNGNMQVGVPSGENYTVVNGSAKEVGTYIATLNLKDPNNYVWSIPNFSGKLTYEIEERPEVPETKPVEQPETKPSDKPSKEPTNKPTKKPSTTKNEQTSNKHTRNTMKPSSEDVDVQDTKPKQEEIQESVQIESKKAKTEVLISMTADELRNAILSKDELNDLEVKLVLSVEENMDNVDKKEMDLLNKVDGVKVSGVYNIDIKKIIGNKYELIKNTNKPIKITINIPKELQQSGKIYSILRCHNGKVSVLKDIDNNPNTITFETDKFSTYAIAINKQDSVKKTSTEKNQKSISIVWLIIGLAILGIIVILLIIKKSKDDKERNI